MPFGTLSQSYAPNCADPKPLVSDYYIVPIDKSFGYDALTHQLPYRSTKYFAINGAYPSSCTTFGYRKADADQIIRTSAMIRPSSS